MKRDTFSYVSRLQRDFKRMFCASLADGTPLSESFVRSICDSALANIFMRSRYELLQAWYCLSVRGVNMWPFEKLEKALL